LSHAVRSRKRIGLPRSDQDQFDLLVDFWRELPDLPWDGSVTFDNRP